MEWIEQNYPQGLEKYGYDSSASNGYEGIILALGEHTRWKTEDRLAYIEITDRTFNKEKEKNCFLIGTYGLERIARKCPQKKIIMIS